MMFLGVYAAFVLAAIVLVSRNRANTLVIVYCLFVFEQWAAAQNAIFLVNSWITNVVAGAIVLYAAVVQYYKGRPGDRGWSTGAIAVWMLFAFSALSVMWSIEPETGVALWKRKLPYVALSLFLVPWVVKSTYDLMRVYWNLLIVGLFLSVLIYTTTSWHGRLVEFDNISEVERTKGNPLEVATLGGLIAIIAVLYGTKFRLFTLSGLLRTAAVVAGITVIVRTGSRGQLLALLLVLFPILLVKNGKTSLKSVVTTMFVAGIASVTIYAAIEHFWGGAKRWGGDLAAKDVSLRLERSLELLSSWINDANPFTVFVGLGNSASYSLQGGYPHNLVAEILAEEGVIGLTILIFAMAWLITRAIKKVKYGKLSAGERDTIIVSVAIFLYLFFLTLKQGSLLVSHKFFMSAVVLSALVKPGAVTSTARSVARRRRMENDKVTSKGRITPGMGNSFRR